MVRNTHTSPTNFDNVGPYDRLARVLLAIVLLTPVFIEINDGPMGWMTIPVLLSVYPAMTVIMAWDPIYEWLGMSTMIRETGSSRSAQSGMQNMGHYGGHGTAAANDDRARCLRQSGISNSSQRSTSAA